MKVEYTKRFIEQYVTVCSQNPLLDKLFKKRTRIFENNPTSPLLNDHALKGKLDKYRAFSITNDIRVVYRIENNTAYFENIGTHKQVYSKTKTSQ